MTFGLPAEPYEVDPVVGQGARPAVHPARRPRAELLDLHGAAGRLRRRPTCSPRSRPASTPCSARCTAAPTRPCSRCSRRIRADGGDVDAFVERVKNKEPGVKLMGFGHRVYKNYDPRAAIVKQTADEVLASARRRRPAARPRHAARGGRAVRRLLHRAQALPERRLLHRPDLPGDGLPDPDVHGAVRDRPAARLDRALARDDRRPGRPRSAARGRSTPARPSATSWRWSSGAASQGATASRASAAPGDRTSSPPVTTKLLGALAPIFGWNSRPRQHVGPMRPRVRRAGGIANPVLTGDGPMRG